MKNIIAYSFILFFAGISLVSCLGDLDTMPLDDNQLVSEKVYQTKDGYTGVLAKCYASLVLTGQKGGDGGDGDLEGANEGYSGYVRLLFYLQELSADNFLMPSSSNGLRKCLNLQWDASNASVITWTYQRLYMSIAYCMKGTDHFKRTIYMYLEQRAEEDALFAKKYRNPAKNMDECVTHILNYVQKSGCNGFTDGEIFGQAIHYYEENEIEVGKPMDCQVVVNHVVKLTAEEKAEARQNAVRKYQEEELRKLQNRHRPSARKENQPQPSLFDLGL